MGSGHEPYTKQGELCIVNEQCNMKLNQSSLTFYWHAHRVENNDLVGDRLLEGDEDFGGVEERRGCPK